MDGDSYMRLKFYVDGSKRKATATIDLKKVRVLTLISGRGFVLSAK